ncbi:MAG: InlB B-repeat-containing protein, partial [Clostridiaceae bacterium]|nr:InlB B-repeat-containing protein [Clostridiaceae bacterium]
MYLDGFLSDDNFVEHGYIYAQQEKGSAAVTYTETYWLYEFNFTVNADATGTGNMFVQEGTVQDTGDHSYSKMYLSKQPAGDGGSYNQNVIPGYSLDFDWSDIGTGVTADNTVTFNAGEGKFADGTATATSTGYIKEAVADVPTPTASGKNFIGWVPSTVSNPTAADVVDASAIAYDYEAVTYNALYEASSGSYTLNVYTMGTDGQYGAPVTTNPGASVGDEVSYTTPAPEGFTIDNALSTLTGTVASDGSTTLNVYLARNKVNVTINGVTGEYFYGEEIADPGDPTPAEGKRFTGWQDKDGNTVTFPFTAPVSGIEVSAVYEDITYTLTYYLDDAKTIVYSTADYKFGDTIVAPADPTTADFGEGKTFIAWDYDVPATMPSHNIDVVAMLEDIAYTVEFIGLDGATAIPGSTLTKYYNDQVTLAEAPDATEEGYTFNGWKYADNSSVTFPITVTDNVKIYADYTIQSFKVSFYTDETMTELFKEYNLEFESEIPDPGTPVKEGYAFQWWDTDIVGSAVSENIAVYAIWEANKYTITFNTDGGTEVAPITQDYATEVVAPTAPTKTGYTFAGWYNGETKVDFPVTMPVDGMALTAKWTANDYTITFNTDGGSAVAPITQAYATEVTAPANPTKTGYTFAGWTPEVPATMPAENVTVKAQWTINQYTITFNTD